MKHGLKGWIAWGALALIIGIPSAELAFSDSDDAVAVAAIEDQEAPLFIGPMPISNTPSSESFTTASAQSSTEAGSKNKSIRIVGDPGLTVRHSGQTIDQLAKEFAEKSAQMLPVPSPDDVQSASLNEPLTEVDVPLRIVASDVKEDGTSLYPPVGVVDADTVASVSSSATRAPIPLPAPIRTSKPTTQFASLSAPIDSRSSVRITQTERAAINRPANQPTRRVNQNLEPFQPGEFAAIDDASDSAFYEVWRNGQRPAGFRRNGSFEEQLPAVRGNGIRMDLLQ